MALNVPVSVVQSNKIILSFQVTDDDGNLFNLTGYTTSFVLKASATATDGSGTTITPSVTSAAHGEGTVTIPGTDIATAPSTLWYRLDVIDGSSNHVTALMGRFSVLSA